MTWEVNSAPNCNVSMVRLELGVEGEPRPLYRLIFLMSGENYVSINPIYNWCLNIGILSITDFDDVLLCDHTLSGL